MRSNDQGDAIDLCSQEDPVFWNEWKKVLLTRNGAPTEDHRHGLKNRHHIN